MFGKLPKELPPHPVLGPFVTERSGHPQWLLIAGVAAGLSMLAMIADAVWPGGPIRLGIAGWIITPVLLVLCSAALWQWGPMRLRFYRAGVVRWRRGRELLVLPYDQVTRMVYRVSAHRHHGMTTGYRVLLELHTAGRAWVSFEGQYKAKVGPVMAFLLMQSDTNEELDEVRDLAAYAIANGLEARLLDGQDLFWGKLVTMSRDGLNVSRVFGSDRRLPFGAVARMDFTEDHLRLFGHDGAKLAAIPVAAENFWPMLMVFQRMAALHAQTEA